VKLSVPLLLNIAVYGAYNDLRLLVNMKQHLFMISLMEFQMGCSIRIPLMTVQKDGKDGLKTEDLPTGSI
jgi:hypothetical protein